MTSLPWHIQVSQHLRTMFRATDATVERLLRLAEDTLSQGYQRLDTAIEAWHDGASAPLAAAAHFLKGALANMGLEELGRTASRLEQAVQANQADDALRLACALRSAIGAMLERQAGPERGCSGEP